MPLFFVFPVVLSVWYVRRQSQVYHEIFEKTCGNLSDLELLERDIMLNPAKAVIYNEVMQKPISPT